MKTQKVSNVSLCRERIRIRCGHRRASNSARADQAMSWTEAVCRRARHRPAKLGNTSPAAVPLPPARRPTLASTTPTFRSEGICSGRGGVRAAEERRRVMYCRALPVGVSLVDKPPPSSSSLDRRAQSSMHADGRSVSEFAHDTMTHCSLSVFS